jgi:thiol:disulfide interchange protein DsbD
MKKAILFSIFISFIFSQDIFPNYPVRLIDNKQTTLHELTNDVTFVSFWATWCIPCIKEIDKINLFIKDYDNVSVVLINEDRVGEIPKIKRLIKTRKYPLDSQYNIVLDFDQKLSRLFSAQPIPLTLILKNNNIIFRKRGFNIGDEIEMKRIIEGVLNE